MSEFELQNGWMKYKKKRTERIMNGFQGPECECNQNTLQGSIENLCKGLSYFDVQPLQQLMQQSNKKQEEAIMQVSYNGFSGELMKLEQKKIYRKYGDVSSRTPDTVYDISIYDDKKRVTHSFTDVEMKDLTFLGGVVTFCG